MATTATVDIGTLITCTPGVYGGRPCLKGTRLPVRQIAVYYLDGVSPEETAREFDVDPSMVYAGIAYYLANREALDADLAESRRLYEAGAAAEREQPHYKAYVERRAHTHRDAS